MKGFILALLLCCSTIYASTETFQVPETFMDEDRAGWTLLKHQIQSSNADTIILLWQGVGGHVDRGDSFVYFINNQYKTIIVKVVGGSYSMHANVVCNARNIDFHRGFLMFHMPADSSTGRVLRYLTYEVQQEMEGCISKGIITQQDIDTVNQGLVLYVYPDGTKRVLNDTRSQ